MTDRETLAARIEAAGRTLAEQVARQSGKPQTQRRVIIGPHGWTLATIRSQP